MRLIKNLFVIITGLSSIASLIFIFINRAEYVTISFHIFLVALLLSFVFFKLHQSGFFTKSPFHTIMVQTRWTWETNHRSTYEVNRIIKCRRPYIGFHIFKHIWSGRGSVDCDSRCDNITYKNNGPDIDISYPIHSCFGETKAINYTLKMQDTDREQKPYLYFGSKAPLDIIILEVVLHDEQDRNPAKILTYKEGETEQHAKMVAEIPFDKVLHTYRWTAYNLAGGQYIVMRWGK